MGIYRASLSGGNNVLPSPWADVKRTDTSVILSDENGNDVGLRIGYVVTPPFEISEVAPFQQGTGDADWVIAEAMEGGHSTDDAVNWVQLKIFAVSGAWAQGDKFNLRCFSSYDVVNDLRVTEWRVNGGTSQVLTNNDGSTPNTSNDVRFLEVEFDANVEILIDWREDASSGGRAHGNAIYLEDFTPTFTVNFDQTEVAPGDTVSGTYANASTVPTSPIVFTPDVGDPVSVPVNINDNGDGTGTFSGTMPADPTSGDIQSFLYGNLEGELT